MTTQAEANQKIQEFLDMCEGMDCSGIVLEVFYGEYSDAYHITVIDDSAYAEDLRLIECGQQCFSAFHVWKRHELLTSRRIAA